MMSGRGLVLRLLAYRDEIYEELSDTGGLWYEGVRSAIRESCTVEFLRRKQNCRGDLAVS